MTGQVAPSDIDLTYVVLPPAEAFRRLSGGEFDGGEMSLASHIARVAEGDHDLVGIPAFPSRTFRHGAVYVRDGAGIAEPADLAGRRVGVPSYQMTAAIWVRGMLEHEYGVQPADLHWVTGGLANPDRSRAAVPTIPGVRIRRETQLSLDELLVCGEIDAIVSPHAPPSTNRASGGASRLFFDVRAVEEDYFRRTGLFPIMHTVVIRRGILEQHPWVAERVLIAFAEAKDNAFRRLRAAEPLPVSLPWFNLDVSRTLDVMGADFWPYGLAGNEHVLQTACDYLFEQGLCTRRVDAHALFEVPPAWA